MKDWRKKHIIKDKDGNLVPVRGRIWKAMHHNNELLKPTASGLLKALLNRLSKEPK